jgi:1-acyl-sn-glycerol-3-phosphate acyltransferase
MDVMKASLSRKIIIMMVGLYVTLRITVIVLYWTTIKGGYERKDGDGLLTWWSSGLVNAVHIKKTVFNPHNVRIEPGKRYIIMSNHRSHYDIPLTILSLPASIRMLTKKELFRIPLWGRGMAAGEFISIDRHNIEQAKKDLEKARGKMEDGIVLWIAPEGTRSRTGRMGTFKKGGFILAIEAGAQIIPLGIRGSEKVLPPKTWEFFLNQEVDIHVGKPIDASAYTLENRDELVEVVRREISALCGEA